MKRKVVKSTYRLNVSNNANIVLQVLRGALYSEVVLNTQGAREKGGLVRHFIWAKIWPEIAANTTTSPFHTTHTNFDLMFSFNK